MAFRTTQVRAAQRALLVCLAAASVMLGACSSFELFRAGGFYARGRAFGIEYVDDDARRLLSTEWIVDNLVPVRSGWPTATKAGPDYRTRIAIDANDDGREEWRGDTDLYDVLLVHRPTGARAWVRVVGLSSSLVDRELSLLARAYVDRVSGGTYVGVELGGEAVVVRERRLAPRLIEEGPAVVDGLPAHRVRFDVVDVDRLEVDPSAPPTRVEIVLVRIPFQYGNPSTLPNYYPLAPGLAVLGFAAPHDRFNEVRPEALDLWSRLRFVDRAGALRPHGETDVGGSTGHEATVLPSTLGPPMTVPTDVTPGSSGDDEPAGGDAIAPPGATDVAAGTLPDRSARPRRLALTRSCLSVPSRRCGPVIPPHGQ